MKKNKNLIFSLLLMMFFIGKTYSQSENSQKNKHVKHNNSNKKNYEDDDYSKNNHYNGNVNVKDLEGKNPDYVYKELKSRNFVINKFYLEGLTTCKIWHNYRTQQCIKTKSIDKRVYSIRNSSECK